MLQHKHLLVKAEIANHISNPDLISSWVSDLVDAIKMKILYGPVSVYCNQVGNQGITSFAIIETSHIALHTWNETTPATLQLDVYTCANLEVDEVFKALELFQPVTLDYKFLDREQGFEEIIESPTRVVEKWVARITEKHPAIGGNRICPFAKMPKVVTVEKLCLGEFIGISDQLTVYMENGIRSSYEDLEQLCRTLKSLNPNFVFLPDHPHKSNYINGHETGNGVFPCIIVQTKQELDSARQSLEKTNYYQYWDKDYLAEIRSFD